jgi:hypothetical protein
MSEPIFTPATRQGVKPLIGLYAESGCGKTMSALLLARGIVGARGRIGMADSESGRGSLYADVIPGGYDVMPITEPFSPRAYIAAIDAADKAGLDCLVLDSGSHEWEGLGGVLDMAGENEQRTGKSGLHNWKTPKMEHAKFVLKLLQTRLPVIVCLRAKHKSRQAKDERGKTCIVKDDHTSPIQAEDFIFEMMAHAEILPDHTIRLTKCSHPALRDCFPADGKEPIGIKHGEAIARWAESPGGKPTSAPADKPKAPKARLWAWAQSKGYTDPAAFEGWLIKESVLSESETLAGMTPARIEEVLERLNK